MGPTGSYPVAASGSPVAKSGGGVAGVSQAGQELQDLGSVAGLQTAR